MRRRGRSCARRSARCAIAGILLEKHEFIGNELDETLRLADEAHPERAAPFVRKPIALPRAFEKKSEPEVAGARPEEIQLAASGPARPAPGE